METFFETNNKKDCNGCKVCALKCPANAINMVEDGEGFIYPEIDEKKCIHCGLCRKICSNYPEKNKYKIKAYATKNKVLKDRITSTSGGMFKLLAENIISKNGVVFGVKYDDEMNVVHSYAETLEKCKEFSISKYVRSDLGNSFEDIKKFLNEGRYVMFTGTPCQNYALKKYLQKDYEKLILCEILCHSNPSPKVYKMYFRNLEIKNNKKIKSIYFRSKNEKVNCKPYVEFEDGSIKAETLYNSAFNKMLISRPCCSNCKFCDSNRKSDISIGDYWGIDKIITGFNDKKGVSLVTVNSEKGNMIFEEIKDKLQYVETTLDEAFKYNHNSNKPENKNRKKFFEKIASSEIDDKNIIKYVDKYIADGIIKKVLIKGKRKVKSLIKV